MQKLVMILSAHKKRLRVKTNSKGFTLMINQEPNCWILKTTSGGLRKNDHWEQFIAENVVAVGWGNLLINPIGYRSESEYKAALNRKYSWDTTHAAKTIYTFSHIPADDLIIIARGYKPSQILPVDIYGIAQAGNFKFDEKSNWWKFKRCTQIFSLNGSLPQPAMAKIFGISSCLQTLHGPFSFSIFDRFCKASKCAYSFSKKRLVVKQLIEPIIPVHSKTSYFIDELDTSSLTEGSRKNIVVDAYERNQKARKTCLKYYGYNCRVCGILFSDIYGKAGNEVIQVHHLKPIYKSKSKHVINPINDLIPVCANCHVIIHTRKPPLSIREVKRTIIEIKKEK
jgi:5-methylcytosine-specific restriction endonuclease McrA